MGGGAAAIAGLVTTAGGVIDSQDASALAAELARQQRALKDLAAAIPDDSTSLLPEAKVKPDASAPEPFGSTNTFGFGALQEEDLKSIRFLREKFEKQDPTWGGLVTRDDGKFGRIWSHPKSRPAEIASA